MSIAIETSEGPLVVPDQHLQAVVRHAQRQAELMVAAFDEHGLFPKRPVGLPAGFLLELAAVLELAL